MQYTLPYIVLLCIYAILSFWYHKISNPTKRGNIAILCAIFYLLFFGFRGFCFYDWNAYYPSFYCIPTNFQEQLNNGFWFEPGFTTLMIICKSIYNNYFFFNFVCCFINTILLTRFLINYIFNIPLGFIIFLCMGGLTISTDLLRNSIAIMIFINALEFIEKKKPIHYFGACILCISFHLSSIIFLPLYFILNRDWGRLTCTILYLVGNAILILRIPIFMGLIQLISVFLDSTTKQHIDEYTKLLPTASFQISIGYLERLLTGVLLIVYYDRIKAYRGSTIFINCIMLYFMMFFAFSEFKTISLRLSMVFAFSYIPIWTDLIQCIQKKGNKYLFVSFITLYCLIKMYNSSNSVIYRYDNALWGADSYNVRRVEFQKNYEGD